MSEIVRSTVSDVLSKDALAASENTLPARLHRGGGMFIESQLSLDIEPALNLTWRIIPTYWQKGFTLMIFRSTSGFSTEKYPDDLNKHGQLIIETTKDDRYCFQPEEGTHYFTFLLHKRGFLGLSERITLVRFSETVPSAKVGIGRIKDKIELRSMLRKHDLDDIDHEAKLHEAELRRMRARKNLEEATNPSPRRASPEDQIIAEELAAVDSIIKVFIAKRDKLYALKRDPEFKKLTTAERHAVMDMIEERLDAAEVSARREMRGS